MSRFELVSADITLEGRITDENPRTAEIVIDNMPIEGEAIRWGDEFYDRIREEVLTANYALRLFITAFMAVVIVPLLAGLLTDAVIGILVAFLALMIVVRFLIISEASLGDEWLESFIVTFLIILFVYIFNLVLVKVIGISPFIDIGV